MKMCSCDPRDQNTTLTLHHKYTSIQSPEIWKTHVQLQAVVQTRNKGKLCVPVNTCNNPTTTHRWIFCVLNSQTSLILGRGRCWFTQSCEVGRALIASCSTGSKYDNHIVIIIHLKFSLRQRTLVQSCTRFSLRKYFECFQATSNPAWHLARNLIITTTKQTPNSVVKCWRRWSLRPSPLPIFLVHGCLFERIFPLTNGLM